jgi:hypothetical protein
VSARIDGDVVVFPIGPRVNRPWKVRPWPPVFLAIPMHAHIIKRTGRLGWRAIVP